MAMQRSSCWRRVVAVGALVAVGWTGGFANAGEGFYAGLAVGREHAGVDYRKSAGVDVAPASHMEAGDDASAGVNALKLSLGYRWALAERFYLSTELEAALYANERVRGFLRGTGVGDRDVWPGAWTLEKSRGVGLNVRVGYAPEALGFLGAGRSVYLVAGVQRLGGAIEAAHGNGVFSGTRAEEFTGTPWLAGAGVEFGSARNRFDLRVSRAAYEVSFSGRGDGSSVTSPRLDYRFEVVEWGVYLGYVRAFSF